MKAGSILIGGHDVREFTCDNLLKNISMVFQNVYLFHDTVINNIRFGNPDASDEQVYAAASVDPENKHLIQEVIFELTHGKTVITIAHRLATIENADQILVIDGGAVAQKGTYVQLLNQEGVYREFVRIRERVESWQINPIDKI